MPSRIEDYALIGDCGAAALVGRPRPSMRLSAWTATATSVARHSSVRERSPSPITCSNLPVAASARARLSYPDEATPLPSAQITPQAA